jgi:hypothetical protein
VKWVRVVEWRSWHKPKPGDATATACGLRLVGPGFGDVERRLTQPPIEVRCPACVRGVQLGNW